MIKMLLALGVLSIGVISGGFQVAHAQIDDKDCGDFASNKEVMDFWFENGYGADNDPHDLDRDNDGLPCEVTQGEYDDYVSDKEGTNQGGTEEGGTNQDGTEEDGAEQGGELPNTATNNPIMMLVGAILTAIGGLFFFRKKQIN